MPKGICCAAQAAGDLGKPLVVQTFRHDPTTGARIAGTERDRCGVCEVGPSCRDPQKLVFKWRFLSSVDCNLAGGGACKVTPAGHAQYQATAHAAATTGQIIYRDNIPISVVPGRVSPPYRVPLA